MLEHNWRDRSWTRRLTPGPWASDRSCDLAGKVNGIAAQLRGHGVEKDVERCNLPSRTGRDFGVLSPLTWRLADLGAKHAFLKAALGWGHMPLHMVKADLDSEVLVKIRLEAVPHAVVMPMNAVFRKDAPPRPAGRAFIAQLKRTRG